MYWCNRVCSLLSQLCDANAVKYQYHTSLWEFLLYKPFYVLWRTEYFLIHGVVFESHRACWAYARVDLIIACTATPSIKLALLAVGRIFMCVFVLFCDCRTLVGRGRAWLRFVLMQKKLADVFRVIVERRERLR